MSKYIDAEKLIAEIERLKKCSESAKMEWIDNGYNQNAFAEDCRQKGFDHLLAFIDSLPEEKPSEDLEEAAEMAARKIYPYEVGMKGLICENSIPIYKAGFIAGAEWAFRQGWTFDAHKGAFGICFDGNIDNLLDSIKDKEEVTVQIRKK